MLRMKKGTLAMIFKNYNKINDTFCTFILLYYLSVFTLNNLYIFIYLIF